MSSYWLVAADGGIFTFGDAQFHGSNGSGSLGAMNGMAITPSGDGYWLSNTAGQVFTYGNAPYYGDLYVWNVAPVVGVAATAPKLKPPGFAGKILDLKPNVSIDAAPRPHAEPRLDLG